MKIGFTGTQDGMTVDQKVALLNFLGAKLQLVWGSNPRVVCEFHHGDCVGADEQAHDIAEALTMEPVIHPPSNPWRRAWRKAKTILPEKGFLDRNKDIVRATDELVATPREFEERLRSGTWSTVRFARKLGRKVTIIQPDGTIA